MLEYMLLLCLAAFFLLTLLRLLYRHSPSAAIADPALHRLCGAITLDISRLCPSTLSLRCAPRVERGRIILDFEIKNEGALISATDGVRLLLTAQLRDRSGTVLEGVGIDLYEDLPPDSYVADAVTLNAVRYPAAESIHVRVLLLTDLLVA
ncbi:MAG: hypothetical protein IJW71_01285 [Clostridia bacterium]|nr:hypothetical protein [Clostridia bacterium]